MPEQEIIPAGRPAGRPLGYTNDIATEICVRLSLGESLRAICTDDHMPARRTVFEWLNRDDEIGIEFRTKYAHAREVQAETLVDDMTDISDNGTNDWMERRDKDGALIGWALNGEAIQRSKLRVETRRWIAEKLKPKKYGAKIDVTTGGDKIVPDIGDAAARAAALLTQARERKKAAEG